MAGTMLNDSIPYDPFSTSYLVKDLQPAFDFSPFALYSPLEDFGALDFAAEPATSSELESPVSSVSPASQPLRTITSDEAGWASPFGSLLSLDDVFKSERQDDSPVLASFALASPVVKPMELSSATDDVPFGGSGGPSADSSDHPLFPSPQLSRAQNPAQINPCSRRSDAAKPDMAVTRRQSQRPTRGLKRKSISSASSSSSSPRSSASPPPVRRAASKEGAPRAAPVTLPHKTAHNMIEKRYRNNLNDKISALRDAVPALRVMVHRLEGHSADEADVDAAAGISGHSMAAQDFDEDLGGLAPAHKLNKASILSKATEYIAHLERKNRALARDNQGLRSKVEGLEFLMVNGAARSVCC